MKEQNEDFLINLIQVIGKEIKYLNNRVKEYRNKIKEDKLSIETKRKELNEVYLDLSELRIKKEPVKGDSDYNSYTDKVLSGKMG